MGLTRGAGTRGCRPQQCNTGAFSLFILTAIFQVENY